MTHTEALERIADLEAENEWLRGELGRRFLEDRRPSLEAQICNLADEIAYNHHDVDDGLRSGLITLEQLDVVAAFSRHRDAVTGEFPAITGRRMIHETLRRMINALAVDLITETRRRIAAAAPLTLDDIHAAPFLAAFGEAMRAEQRELKAFLFENLYKHFQVLRMTNKARTIVSDLFAAFMADPRLLPPQYQRMAEPQQPVAEPDPKARAVADYIAGMTDRYAIREHRRLFAIGEI